MKEQITAKSYAKSIYELAQENKQDVAGDLTKITEAINSSNDLENLLFLEVFTVEEKLTVINSILEKLNVTSLTKNFVSFLVSEKRMNLFPLVFKEVTVIDDNEKGFLRGTIEGEGESIPEDQLSAIKSYLSKKLNKEPKLEYKRNETLTAGFRVTAEDLQLDATIDNQFDVLRQNILGE